MSLLFDFKNGNKKALERIYNKYHKRLFHLAYTFTSNEEEAKDLVHDIILKFYLGRNKLSEDVTIEAQLIRIAKFYILDYLKSKRNITSDMVDTLVEAESTGDIDKVKEQKVYLLKAVEQLPLECKEIFKLHKFEGLSHKEISEFKGVAVKTVENQVSKALKILKSVLSSQ
ncbi:RNA polymerase sigma factor [Neptunitalea lumnitzerae]|uniref:DNA-directed RNA polymerase sigma-70 factor n=1 Tax=Neptunitalea lumnitzerae TaxID=2965509 RepID=A0ABQ5MJQ0_9FLAO|nr:sigma-70 family RNA polymerase sigma factor [Neptunitalea sp. Y10]GLB49637.1 DNA-directed RNA polymerase sigma-70 factor [Neptunitalea sp. Y10]